MQNYNGNNHGASQILGGDKSDKDYSPVRIGGIDVFTPQAKATLRRLVAEENGVDPELDNVKGDPEQLRRYLANRLVHLPSHIEAVIAAGNAKVRWVYEGFATRSMVTTLYGHGGVGKSLLALEAAIMLASGNDWLGFKAAQCSGTVVYVDYEMHYEVQAQRIAMFTGGVIPSRFRLVVPHHAGSREELFKVLLYLKPDLVVIDSFSAYVGGRDTTREDVVVQAIRALQQFAETANCAVLVVDHVTKNDAANEATTPYGSVFKHNLVRLAWHVRDVEPNLLELTCTKNNLQDAQKLEKTFQVRRCTDEQYMWHERCTTPQGGYRGAIVRYLQTAGEVGVTVKEISDYLEQEGYEVSSRTVLRCLHSLGSLVVKDGSTCKARYRLRQTNDGVGDGAF